MAETMLAARLDLDTRRFGVVRVPVPEPGAGEVLVEVAAAGVCLSDLHLIDGTLVPPGVRGPVTLGHEVAGTVVAVGAGGPADVPVGRRVVLHAGQACGRCDQCLRHRQPCPRARTRGVHCDGGWAQYALATADAVIPIPDGLPFEQAAIVPDAVSTPYAAIVDTAAVRPGQAVGVWGVGGLGAHAVQLLRLVGAAPIIAVDPLPAARLRALDLGADIALDPAAEDMVAEVLAATGGRGLHAAFDTAGVAAVREQALAALAPSGALVVIGLAGAPIVVPSDVLFGMRRTRLLGHFGSSAQHVEELVGLARHGRLDLARSVSARVPLAEADRAVRLLAGRVGDPVRVVLVNE